MTPPKVPRTCRSTVSTSGRLRPFGMTRGCLKRLPKPRTNRAFCRSERSRASTGPPYGPREAMRCGSSRCAAPGKRRSAIMKATEFDKKFDAGEDVSDAIDWSQARRRNDQPKRVNVDFPAWVVEGLDKQARHLGVTRQSLIKLWIAERLQ